MATLGSSPLPRWLVEDPPSLPLGNSIDHPTVADVDGVLPGRRLELLAVVPLRALPIEAAGPAVHRAAAVKLDDHRRVLVEELRGADRCRYGRALGRHLDLWLARIATFHGHPRDAIAVAVPVPEAPTSVRDRLPAWPFATHPTGSDCSTHLEYR